MRLNESYKDPLKNFVLTPWITIIEMDEEETLYLLELMEIKLIDQAFT